MKKAIMLALLLTTITPAQASEIAGTRVAGQGAVCEAGQGKGVEFNIATKQETSYCYELPVIVPPTVEQVEEKAKTTVAESITKINNQNPVTVVAKETVSVEPQPITEILTKVEVNATTKVVTVSPLTPVELDQVAKDRAVGESRNEAKTKAQESAAAEQGTEQCVNWSAQGQSGTECALDPILATEEEVEEFWNIFTFTFFNWYELLKSDWRW